MAKILITGVRGCLGSWAAWHLCALGHAAVGVDISHDRHRLGMVGLEEGAFPILPVDLRDAQRLGDLVRSERPDAIIHLAALQVPFCRADPTACVQINVGGTMLLLELCRELHMPLVYASSAAVYGPDLGRPLGEGEGVAPQTLYGVFKHANEEMARVYALEYGVRSAGFRPYVVYGPGRDQGMTSDVTTALVRAARGEPFRIRFGGMIALQHAEDAALAFVRAALAPPADARIYNLRGAVVDVEEVVRVAEAVTGTRGLITWDAPPLPIAADLSDRAFQNDYGPFAYRDLEQGMRETLEVLRAGRRA